MADEVKSDLDILAPEPREVTVTPYGPVSGQRQAPEIISVAEFRFGQWPRAIRLFRPVTDAVRNAGIAGFNGAGLTLATDWAIRLPQVMDEGGEALIEFVGFAIGKPRAWFDTLDGYDGIALTKAVFEVNASFFVQKLVPMLGLAVQTDPAAQVPADGAASSPDSSTAATPETASIA